MNNRYTALHTITVLLQILALIIIALGVLLPALMLWGGHSFLPSIFSTLSLLWAIPIFIFSLICALILWAISDLIRCLIDIEHNTRASLLRDKEPILRDDPQLNLTDKQQSMREKPEPVVTENNSPILTIHKGTPDVQNEPVDEAGTTTQEEPDSFPEASKGTILTGRPKGTTKRAFSIKDILSKKLW